MMTVIFGVDVVAEIGIDDDENDMGSQVTRSLISSLGDFSYI